MVIEMQLLDQLIIVSVTYFLVTVTRHLVILIQIKKNNMADQVSKKLIRFEMDAIVFVLLTILFIPNA